MLKTIYFRELEAKVKRLQREKSLMDRLRHANESLSREAEVNSIIANLFSKPHGVEVTRRNGAVLVLQNAKQLTESRWGYIGYPNCRKPNVFTVIAQEDTQLDGGDDFAKDVRGFGPMGAAAQEKHCWQTALKIWNYSGISSDGYFSLDRIISVPAIVNGKVLGERYHRFQCVITPNRMQPGSRALQTSMPWRHNICRLPSISGGPTDYLENVFENSPDAIGIVDENGKFIKWNKMAAELFGYAFEDLKDLRAFDNYADKGEFDHMLAQLETNSAVRKYEVKMRKKGQRRFT